MALCPCGQCAHVGPISGGGVVGSGDVGSGDGDSVGGGEDDSGVE